MTPRERGFLLLSSNLGDPARRPLSVAQLRTLAERAALMEPGREDRELELRDLTALGYSRPAAEQILNLLDGEELLDHYLRRGEKLGCRCVTRVTEGYPLLLRKRLGLESPGCLWALGDLTLLEQPAVALVGSRELREPNWEFAREVGRRAAEQGYVLVSGNARGADRTAQEACLEAGGAVVSVVADQLWKQKKQDRVLYLSENGYDEGFSALRALSRNRCIHALGTKTFVAQCREEMGGTWHGTVKNLRHGWSSVYCFDDGSAAMSRLLELGASCIKTGELHSFYDLGEPLQQGLFDD